MAKSNFVVHPNCAYSYSTAIGVWRGTTAIVNRTKYSPTTSKHQNLLVRQLTQAGYTIKYVDFLEYGISPDTLWALGNKT